MDICKILLSSLLLLLTACQQRQDYQQLTEDLKKNIQEFKTDITDQYQKQEDEINKVATAELEKLLAVEYHVFELPAESSTANHQEKLNEIGKERWDCFFIDRTSELYRVYCRRQPKSYLRYLSQLSKVIP